MDPLLEHTATRPRLSARERARLTRPQRTPSRFERWAWSEVPAYRLSLTLGYAGTIYFGVSAFIAGVPAFDIAAPEGWTPIWALVLVLGGVLGLGGSVKDSPRFRTVELASAFILAGTLTVYAGTILVIAYGSGDVGRATAGAGFVGLAVPPAIRLLWLIANAFKERENRRARTAAVAAAAVAVPVV